MITWVNWVKISDINALFAFLCNGISPSFVYADHDQIDSRSYHTINHIIQDQIHTSLLSWDSLTSYIHIYFIAGISTAIIDPMTIFILGHTGIMNSRPNNVVGSISSLPIVMHYKSVGSPSPTVGWGRYPLPSCALLQSPAPPSQACIAGQYPASVSTFIPPRRWGSAIRTGCGICLFGSPDILERDISSSVLYLYAVGEENGALSRTELHTSVVWRFLHIIEPGTPMRRVSFWISWLGNLT